jgi:hypothetical protein
MKMMVNMIVIGEPEKWLLLLRKAAGAQIAQCRTCYKKKKKEKEKEK